MLRSRSACLQFFSLDGHVRCLHTCLHVRTPSCAFTYIPTYYTPVVPAKYILTQRVILHIPHNYRFNRKNCALLRGVRCRFLIDKVCEFFIYVKNTHFARVERTNCTSQRMKDVCDVDVRQIIDALYSSVISR